jgi:hypothetical protein
MTGSETDRSPAPRTRTQLTGPLAWRPARRAQSGPFAAGECWCDDRVGSAIRTGQRVAVMAAIRPSSRSSCPAVRDGRRQTHRPGVPEQAPERRGRRSPMATCGFPSRARAGFLVDLPGRSNDSGAVGQPRPGRARLGQQGPGRHGRQPGAVVRVGRGATTAHGARTPTRVGSRPGRALASVAATASPWGWTPTATSRS